MKEASAKAIVRAPHELGFEDEVEVHADYSGRGMYGRTTCGVSAMTMASLMASAAAASSQMDEQKQDEFVEDLLGLALDNLGRGWIVY